MREDRRRGTLAGVLVDLSLVAGSVVVLGLLAGVLWPQLVDPAMAERTADGVSTDEVQLGKLFAADGWFIVLGFVGSAILGALLMLRRRGHEVVVLLLLLGGTYLAARGIAEPIGVALGPPDPVAVLSKGEVGDKAPSRLCTIQKDDKGEVIKDDDGKEVCGLSSRADLLAWPLGGAVGSLVVLLAVTRLGHDRPKSPPHGDLTADPPHVAAD